MGWVVNASPEVNDQSQYPTIIAISTTLTVVATAVVATRIWIRHRARGLAADDWFSIVSAVFCIIYAVLCIVQTRYGLGLPLLDRPRANKIIYTRTNYAGRPIYQLGISFFKIALLISYLRLLKGTAQKTYRIVVWVMIAVIFMGHFGCALSLIFACDPVDKSWNPDKVGTCLPAGPSFTAYAVVTIVSDVMVALTPLPVLLKLNIATRKKVALVGIFILGLFTTLCSILRYLEIDRIQFGDGNSTMLILWGVIEFNVGNMTSSLPFLAPVFYRKAREYRSKPSSGGYGQSSGGRSKSRGIKLGDHYKLESVNTAKGGGVFSSNSGSEENILKGNIMKSVTYTVEVDEEQQSQKSGGVQQPSRVHAYAE